MAEKFKKKKKKRRKEEEDKRGKKRFRVEEIVRMTVEE